MRDEYAFQWLSGGTGREFGAPFAALRAAQWAMDFAGRSIDGQQWLAGQKFARIELSIFFPDDPPQSSSPPGLGLRLRRGVLAAHYVARYSDLAAIPESSWPWRMLELVFATFEEIADKYDLGRPPLRDPATLAGGMSSNESVSPPAHTSTANVSGEFNGLEDDEILVVAPYILENEDADTCRARQDRIEALLVERIGAVSASSAADAAYTWSVRLPDSVSAKAEPSPG